MQSFLPGAKCTPRTALGLFVIEWNKTAIAGVEGVEIVKEILPTSPGFSSF